MKGTQAQNNFNSWEVWKSYQKFYFQNEDICVKRHSIVWKSKLVLVYDKKSKTSNLSQISEIPFTRQKMWEETQLKKHVGYFKYNVSKEGSLNSKTFVRRVHQEKLQIQISPTLLFLWLLNSSLLQSMKLNKSKKGNESELFSPVHPTHFSVASIV